MLKNIRTKALTYGLNEVTSVGTVKVRILFRIELLNRLPRALLYDSHMKRKMYRLNWQGNAERSEYEKMLPGGQPVTFQN